MSEIDPKYMVVENGVLNEGKSVELFLSDLRKQYKVPVAIATEIHAFFDKHGSTLPVSSVTSMVAQTMMANGFCDMHGLSAMTRKVSAVLDAQAEAGFFVKKKGPHGGATRIRKMIEKSVEVPTPSIVEVNAENPSTETEEDEPAPVASRAV